MHLRGARRLRGGFNLPILFAMLIDFYGNMTHARYRIISYFDAILQKERKICAPIALRSVKRNGRTVHIFAEIRVNITHNSH